jgi:hypothetical protein
MRSQELARSLALVASSALVLTLIPVFIQLGIETSYSIPLAILIGLGTQPMIPLLLVPSSADVLQPTTLVSAYFLTDFALRAFYLAAIPYTARMGENPYDDYLVLALWYTCAGFVAFSVGYSSRMAKSWTKRLNSAMLPWPRKMPSAQILVMLAISIGCMEYLFKSGQVVGNFVNKEFQNHPPPGMVILLERLVDFSWIAISIALIIPSKKPPKGEAWLLMGLCILGLGARLAITGGKQSLIQPILETALVIHYGRRRFRLWEMVAIGVPTLVLAFGLVNFYRFVVVGTRGSPKSVEDLVSRVSTAADLLTSKRTSSQDRSPLDQLVERDAGVDALALILKYTPHPFPYYWGAGLIEVPLTFMPRFLWKEKPVDLPSVVFEETYMGEPFGYNGFSSIHLISDMYRNFSIFGLLGGMFVFGLAARWFYLFCGPSRDNPTGIFIYAALFPEILHSLETDIGNTMVVLIRLVLLIAGTLAFMGVRYRRSFPTQACVSPPQYCGLPLVSADRARLPRLG